MAHAEILSSDLIKLDSDWSEKFLVEQLPGKRWHNDPIGGKYWTVPLSWASCIVLRGVFGPGLTIGPDLTAWAWQERAHVQSLLDIRTLTAPTDVVAAPSGSRLYPFQEVGAAFLSRAGGALLGDEMGTGKTIQALAALAARPDSLPAIVICPNGTKRNWAAEAASWFPDAVPYVIDSRGGASKSKAKIIANAARDPKALVIVNFEALRGLSRLAAYGSIRLTKCSDCDPASSHKPTTCQVHARELNKISWRSVVVDEAHRIKDPKSQQTRAVWALADQTTVVNRWALTGTPIANHPGDLWSILRFVDRRSFPGKTAFVDRYCQTSFNPWGGMEITGVREDMREEFFQLLDPHFRRMTKSLVLSQLPPKVRTTRWVEMTPGQRKAYNDLESTLGTVLPDGRALIAAEPIVARTRLMQFASSSLTYQPGDDPTDLSGWQVKLCDPSPKVDALMELLDEMGGKPVVVCAESKQLIELAAKRLTKAKIHHGLITGGVTPYERDRVLREFQSGQLPVLLFTVKAGGVGLTMTAADTIIFLQRSWSLIDTLQAEDRVHRIGSEIHESINIIDLVTKDSVEEDQIHALSTKLFRLEEIVRDKALLALHGKDDEITQLNAEEQSIMKSELL